MVHGILGSKRNLSMFAKMLLEEHPSWQVLLVDLRSHGESATVHSRPGPHTVETAAADVLHLLRHLRLFPTMLVGHSFGGKVVMSMVHQFGSVLPKPVNVWVLDTLPGRILLGARAPGGGHRDHPRALISALLDMPLPIASRMHCVDALMAQGFSEAVSRWVATNLRPVDGRYSHKLVWTFDLAGIAEMYDSYEETQLWDLLRSPPRGLTVDFVRAEHSNFRWAGGDEAAIRALGHSVHLLRDSGHWVHTDNPRGLIELLQPAFGRREDVSLIHETYAASIDADDEQYAR